MITAGVLEKFDSTPPRYKCKVPQVVDVAAGNGVATAKAEIESVGNAILVAYPPA